MTHMAMSSIRVMATCALLGKADSFNRVYNIPHKCKKAQKNPDFLDSLRAVRRAALNLI